MVQRPARNRLLSIASTTLAGAFAAATLAGCSTGVEAGTLDFEPLNGARVDVGGLQIRNALLVVSEQTSGTAVVALTLVNNGSSEDVLTGVELAVEATAEPVPAVLQPRSIRLLPGTVTIVPTGSRPYIELETDATPGSWVDVVLRFEAAGAVPLKLQVVAATEPYATLTPVEGS